MEKYQKRSVSYPKIPHGNFRKGHRRWKTTAEETERDTGRDEVVGDSDARNL